ncbi:MAG: ribonuclease D [Pseudohongiella sp.]|nr:MAG: ribonuclease D [Pseudohongiella sp.]
MPIQYVSDSATLNELCAEWSGEEFLAVDTEFERTSTFYARIGLLQIADSKNCYLIDPLTIDDWDDFKSLIASESCTLVMHSCSEDLSLLQTFLGILPASVFDTQLAAAFLGIGFSISYQALVEQLTGVEVAKDETRSNWIKRPLSDTQIHYAAADVRYLLQVREILSGQIEQKGMSDWLQAECEQQLLNARRLEEESQWHSYYTAVSNAWRLDNEGLQALQQLCVWREQKARQRNKPRSWIVKDNDLLALSKAVSGPIRSEDFVPGDVNNAEGVDSRFISRNGSELYKLLNDSSSRVEVDPGLLNKPLNAPLRNKLKKSKQLANSKAEELGMSPELLGRKKFLVELLRSYEREGQLQWTGEMAGWRRVLLEEELTALVAKD